MKVANWNDILPTHEAIRAMAPEKLEAASSVSRCDEATLAFGIAGIGNLIACTASNKETGLSEDAVTHVGWLLDALGDLIGKLADTDAGVQYQLQKNEKEIEGMKPKAALARRSGGNTLGSTNARV